jgi:hypothetical protein
MTNNDQRNKGVVNQTLSQIIDRILSSKFFSTANKQLET